MQFIRTLAAAVFVVAALILPAVAQTALTITPATGTHNKALSVSQAGPTGSTAGPLVYNDINILHQSTVTGTGADSYGFTNAQMTGLRVSIDAQGAVTGQQIAGTFRIKDVTTNTTTGVERIGLVGGVYATTNSPNSSIYGTIGYATVDSTGVKPDVLAGEMDIGIASTASATNVIGLRVTNQPVASGASAGQGTNLHTAFAVSSLATDSGAFKSILALQPSHGGKPISTTGSFILSDGAVTMANFLKADNWTITGDIIVTPHVKLTGLGALTLNANAASLPTPPTGTLLHIGNADATQTRVALDAFGTDAFSGINYRHARGTAASKTATQSGDIIGFNFAYGYGTSGFTTNAGAGMVMFATENHADGAAGSRVDIYATQASTGLTGAVARFDRPTAATQTALLLYDVDNNTIERVTVGAADSGGSGFKVLRIPN